MILWTKPEREKFWATWLELWPLRGHDTLDAKTKAWERTVQRFRSEIAEEAIRELWESQERRSEPTPLRFSEAAQRIAQSCSQINAERIRQDQSREKHLSPQEIAADHTFWAHFQREYEGHKVADLLPKWREGLRQGKLPLQVAPGREPGDDEAFGA
jgi:hypothetical protein